MTKLSIENILDILCHYDYTRQEIPSNYFADVLDDIPYLYGMALDDQKRIIVDKNQCYENMRETILHELYHCHHYLKGDLDGKGIKKVEKIVDKEAKDHMKQLYQK